MPGVPAWRLTVRYAISLLPYRTLTQVQLLRRPTQLVVVHETHWIRSNDSDRSNPKHDLGPHGLKR
jgi:hypothetical protein